MTKEEIRLQVAISVIQGVLEAKHGVIGEVVPSVAVTIALRIADAFVEEWYRETKEQSEAASIKGYLNRDIGGQLIISLSPDYMEDEWMLLESKLFPNIKSEDTPHCVDIIIKEIK